MPTHPVNPVGLMEEDINGMSFQPQTITLLGIGMPTTQVIHKVILGKSVF